MKIVSFKEVIMFFAVIQFNNIECGCCNKEDKNGINSGDKGGIHKPTKKIVKKNDVVNAVKNYVNDKSNRYPNANNVPDINVSEEGGKIVLKCGKFTAISNENFDQLNIDESSITSNGFSIFVESTKSYTNYNFFNGGKAILGAIISSLNNMNKQIREDGEHYLTVDDIKNILNKAYIKLSSGKVYVNYIYGGMEYLAIPNCLDEKIGLKNVGTIFYRDGMYSEIDIKNEAKTDNINYKNRFDNELNNIIENRIDDLMFHLTSF